MPAVSALAHTTMTLHHRSTDSRYRVRDHVRCLKACISSFRVPLTWLSCSKGRVYRSRSSPADCHSQSKLLPSPRDLASPRCANLTGGACGPPGPCSMTARASYVDTYGVASHVRSLKPSCLPRDGGFARPSLPGLFGSLKTTTNSVLTTRDRGAPREHPACHLTGHCRRAIAAGVAIASKARPTSAHPSFPKSASASPMLPATIRRQTLRPLDRPGYRLRGRRSRERLGATADGARTRPKTSQAGGRTCWTSMGPWSSTTRAAWRETIWL